MPDDSPLPLADRIIEELGRRPHQKAAELAKVLGVERREVNRCLSHQLAGKVEQNQAYRWSLRTAIPAPRGRSSQPAQNSPD